jgi:hypothetical protein
MVTMSNVGAGLGLGVQTLAFAALNKSDNLNRFVGWISGGSINRDKLAERILHKALDLGVSMAVDAKALGERSAVLIPAMRDAAIANDMGRMKAAVADLASEGLSKVMDKNAGGSFGVIVKGAVDGAVRTAASTFAENVVGDHAAEKVIATLVKEHGWEPLDAKLKAATSSLPMKDFVCRQIHGIIQRAIVDKPEYDMRGNAEYRAVAGLANQFLTDGTDYATPLREYAPKSVAVIETAQRVVAAVPLAIDSLQEALGSAPQAVDARSAFATVKDAPPPVVSEQTTARELARALILESVLTERVPEAATTSGSTPGTSPSGDTEPTAPSTVTVADRLETATLSPEKRAELDAVADQVSSAQLKPLGERGGLEVAQTWSGALASVQAHSHLVTNTSDESAQATVSALQRAPVETTDRGGYEIGAAFGKQVKDIKLDLPVSAMGYTDSAVEGGRALLNTGWAMFGYSTGPDWAESAVLKQVYNCCGQNADVMSEATRFLDPALARDALVMPTMRSLGAAGGEVLLGETRLQLARGEPAVSFEMSSQEGLGFVAVTMSTQWNVTGFGTPGDAELRKPLGDAAATMTASATVHIHPGVDGGPPRTEFFPLGVVTSISNTVSFDRASGETV